MKKAAATFFAILTMAVGAQAASITVTNLFQGSYGALDSNSAPIPQGSGYVAIGTFTIDDATIQSLGANMDAAGIAAGFVQFNGSITMGGLRDGFFQGSLDGAITAGDGLAGTQVYTVIGTGSSITDSGSLIVYRNADVTFQPDPAPTSDARLDATPDAIVLGEAVMYDPGNGTQIPGIQGQFIIPEPSSALLGLVGIAFVAFRRRR